MPERPISSGPATNPVDPREKLKVAYQDVRVASSYDEERDFRATDVSLHYETEIIGLREALRGVRGPILEVAIGTGRLCRRLRDVGPSDMPYVGLDVSFPMLYEAKRSLRENLVQSDSVRPVHLLRGDAFQMPFHDRHFHAVVGFRFIKHLSPPNRGLMYKEVNRLLVKDGLLIFDFYGWRRRARSQEEGHRLTPPALRKELEESGFRPIKIYGTRHLLPALLSVPFRALGLKSPVKALGLLEVKLLSPIDELLGRSRGGIVVAKKIVDGKQ
ncbi:MAG TPA: class I SAM-dependent methyltransferase [Candidatus Tripitaka californicus]|uniref:class I SAM-dependent methyltransferase n=1 Tax=Candidatus Tripitaka californicus TaxID=3367616 RepID=UPI0040252996